MYSIIYTIGTFDDSTQHVVPKSSSVDRKCLPPVKIISTTGTHVYATQLMMFIFP